MIWLLGDERAARLYEEITYSDKKFSPKKSPSYYGCLKRAGYMDGELIRYARELHAQGKPFVTVNAGCGLDTRGERIAGATYGAAHYDVDFPNVIELRQRLLGESATALGSDLLGGDWLARLASEITPETQVLITIEGVFAYFTLEQIQLLLERVVLLGSPCPEATERIEDQHTTPCEVVVQMLKQKLDLL